MQATIDKFGRIVIPKRLREQFGWTAGTQIEVREDGNKMQLEAASDLTGSLKKEGNLTVYHGGKPLRPLADCVNEEREARIQFLIRSGKK